MKTWTAALVIPADSPTVRPSDRIVEGRPSGNRELLSRLSPRQVRILRELATGDTAAVTSKRLGMNYQTLKNELTEVYNELGVTGLVAAYASLGWLVAEE
jgi:DNA-binding CsgD family transcriptional regulator